MDRAYSLLELKTIDDDARLITGIASTPSTDRVGDIVEPKGAQFRLPLPLLMQHRSDSPIGHVTKAKVTDAGIEITAQIAKTATPGELKSRLDSAWESIKIGLIRGLSIGFKAIETADIEGSWGQRFLKWEWLELSAVTIPANSDASIQTIKGVINAELAATGHRSTSPGATGKPVLINPKRGGAVATFSVTEKIKDLEATRQAKAARMMAIQEAAGNAGRTKDATEQDEFDGIKGDLEGIDRELKDLHDMEALMTIAKPVPQTPRPKEGSSSIIRVQSRRDKGIGFARYVKAFGVAKRYNRDVEAVARQMYPDDHEVQKAVVSAGSTTSSNWAEDLTGSETGVFADFVEFLRPMTILGKFGQGGIPALRRVPFRTPLISQTAGGEGYWTGEGKAKPLTAFDFARTTLEPLKVANIAVLTQESLDSSSPSSEAIVRDQLAAALTARMDVSFIDPDNNGDAGIEPASITDAVVPIESAGQDAAGVRTDIGALFDAFISADNPPSSGVWIMSARRAMRLGLMRTDLSVREFPDINMAGGTLEGLPVIASEHVPTDDYGDIVVLVNAGDIYLGDDGGITVDMSREASLQMLDKSGSGAGAVTLDSIAPTAASLVSMFQTNSVAFRAERTISWMRRRASGVQVLSGVLWGEPEVS